jgi:hypothetical protein
MAAMEALAAILQDASPLAMLLRMRTFDPSW